jgi:hypothetical protein
VILPKTVGTVTRLVPGANPPKFFGPIEKAHIFTYVSKTGADERSFVSLASLLWRLHKPVGFVAV